MVVNNAFYRWKKNGCVSHHERMTRALFMQTYLSYFRILTNKGLVGIGELRRELVDVQHVDGDGHPAGQNWTICKKKENTKQFQ